MELTEDVTANKKTGLRIVKMFMVQRSVKVFTESF